MVLELSNDVLEKLEEQNIRLTRRRKAILRALAQEPENHLSAEDIYLKIKQDDDKIGLATVYRTLDLFAQANIIHTVDFGDGCRRFELVSDTTPHYHHHLLCLSCKNITEFAQDLLEDLEHQIEDSTGFCITNHSLRFYGYCHDCQEKE
ncbi:MAG TPA: transcriptional repressor [Firmicutes bacterium]|nr:transcriptional repressor [Bacillota bacterium]